MPDIRTPGSPAQRRGTPNTVTKVLPVKMVFVEYADEGGRVHDALAIVFPDNVARRVWTSPTSEQLLSTYQPFGDKVEKQILEHMRAAEQVAETKAAAPPAADLSEQVEVPL